MSKRQSPSWAAYIALLKGSKSQVAFAHASGQSQGKISRWMTGEQPPTQAAVVADLARRLGRNPLEAFVAAGMLSEPEAGRGLMPEDRAQLAAVRMVTEMLHKTLARGGQKIDPGALGVLVAGLQGNFRREAERIMADAAPGAGAPRRAAGGARPAGHRGAGTGGRVGAAALQRRSRRRVPALGLGSGGAW